MHPFTPVWSVSLSSAASERPLLAMDYVHLTIYPQEQRAELGLAAGKSVAVPTRINEKMHVSSLLEALAKQLPSLAPQLPLCHVLLAGSPLGLDDVLQCGDDVSLHIVPPLDPDRKPGDPLPTPPPSPLKSSGKLASPQKARSSPRGKGGGFRTPPSSPSKAAPTSPAKRATMAQSAAPLGGDPPINDMDRPVVHMFCSYQPQSNWPPPLPPTSVLLSSRGLALEHARERLLLPGTKCFWVIPGVVLAGAAPTTETMLKAILSAGVGCFVDLRVPGEGLEYAEAAREAQAALVEVARASSPGGGAHRPRWTGSIPSARYAPRTPPSSPAKANITRGTAGRTDPDGTAGRGRPPSGSWTGALEFMSCPIPHNVRLDTKDATNMLRPDNKGGTNTLQHLSDTGTCPDTWLCTLAAKLLQKAHGEGTVVYIHCSGGHFRTGTLCSVLIGLAYGLSGTHALQLFQAMHDLAGNVFDRAPSSSAGRADDCRALFPAQREQVLRLLSSTRDYAKASTAGKLLGGGSGGGGGGDDDAALGNSWGEMILLSEEVLVAIAGARSRIAALMGKTWQGLCDAAGTPMAKIAGAVSETIFSEASVPRRMSGRAASSTATSSSCNTSPRRSTTTAAAAAAGGGGNNGARSVRRSRRPVCLVQ
jgi:hypothetical protein